VIITLGVLFMALANILAALLVQGAVISGERFEMEQRGKVLVDRWFAAKSREAEAEAGTSPWRFQRSTTRFGDITAMRRTE